MDEFAAKSFQRAERAEKAEYFAKEIVPFTVYQKNASTGVREKVVVDRDDGIRYGTTKESLSKIRGAFPQWGKATTTGGNASQITDGAAAVLLMTRRKAEELGLSILGRYVSTAVCGKYHHMLIGFFLRLDAGVPPRIMGVGPVYAVPMVLKNVGITVEDVDLFEASALFWCSCSISVLRAIFSAVVWLDKRSVRVTVLIHGTCLGTGHGKGQRERWSHCVRTPPRCVGVL